MPLLAGWESFYVIVGSSAAALTGLMFVVIALGSETRTPRQSDALHAFATPTIVHFCAVLLLAALLTTPRQTISTLRLCMMGSAVAALIYMAWVVVQAGKQRAYTPVLDDWIWHGILPIIAYASLLFSGILLGREPEAALYGVGASALLLLFIGIHNAWDAAVWMLTKRPRRKSRL